LAALNEQMVSPTNVLSHSEDSKEHTHTQGEWHAYTHFAYRYRPNGLTVGVWGKVGGSVGSSSWTWRVAFADSAGNEAVVYTSGDIDPADDYEYQTTDIDLTAGAAATALAAAGITLTFGSGYLITIEAKRNTDDYPLYLRWGLCLRTSTGAAGGSWADNKLWAHLDTDVGPTQLNKIRADLLELYTGGAEELWGENHAVRTEDDDRPHSGTHLKRYLNYICAPDETPVLLYGDDFGEEYSLPTGVGWLGFDLSTVGLTPGMAYYVNDAAAAFEADGIYVEA
jgi:hypothetical protein